MFSVCTKNCELEGQSLSSFFLLFRGYPLNDHLRIIALALSIEIKSTCPNLSLVRVREPILCQSIVRRRLN